MFEQHQLSRRMLLKAAATIVSSMTIPISEPASAGSQSLTGMTIYLPLVERSAPPIPIASTLRELGEKTGILFGTSVDGSEEWTKPEYEAAVQHFSLIAPSGSFLPEWFPEDSGMANAFLAMATRNHQALFIAHAFWHQMVREWLRTASDAEILAYMQAQIRALLAYVRKSEDGTVTTYINFINEPIWAVEHARGWEESPFYRLFGDKLLSEIYLMFLDEAAPRELVVGRDLRLVYNDYDIYRAGNKGDFALEVLTATKADIAKRLNVAQDQVLLDIGLQYRFNPELDPQTHEFDDLGFFPAPTAQETQQNLARFSQIGPIHITEFEVRGENDQPHRQTMQLYAELTEAAIDSGVVTSISYYGTFRNQPNSTYKYVYNQLFDSNYEPTNDYHWLLNHLAG